MSKIILYVPVEIKFRTPHVSQYEKDKAVEDVIRSLATRRCGGWGVGEARFWFGSVKSSMAAIRRSINHKF